MRKVAARRVTGVGLVVVLVAGVACGGAKIFRTSADEFAKLAGTQVDQLKPVLPQVEEPVQQAVGTVRTFAARVEATAEDIKEVVCNDVFQAAIEAEILPTSEKIAAALGSSGIRESDAATFSETISAQARDAYTLGWDGFLAFVARMCDVQGALEF